MEQGVDNGYSAVCSTCLSSDRNLISINGLTEIYQVFRLLMYDFAGERFGDTLTELEQTICWECLALMKRFIKFKRQVHSAQEHLRVLLMSQSQGSMDHTYMSQSLSSLEMTTKANYDSIFFDYTTREQTEWPQHFIAISSSQNVKNEHYDVAQAVRDNINLDIDDHIDDHMLEVPEIVLENPVTGVMSHIVVGTDALVTPAETYPASTVKGELAELAVSTINSVPKIEYMKQEVADRTEQTSGYDTDYMTEAEMLASREEAKQKIQYASAVYKCELCIIGFYSQQQVEDHFISTHREKPGLSPCKVCYVYIEESKLQSHVNQHYTRHICKMCGHMENSTKLISLHVKKHLSKQIPSTVIKIGDVGQTKRKGRKKKEKDPPGPPKPGDLRRLLSKTTIEGYQCLECDMFFKSSRARKTHVARYHREGLQCDHCKKRFVNRTTLATHLRLHEGPLPREECPICHKMVRVIQLKYHIQRHQNKSQYECTECKKVFSHLATYQAHLKYSRAHASDQVFKFPCPMCNKGYPTKEAMQDHFNYQHLGKTAHKCPTCDKPIASRANVEKHMMRVHGEKKEKPRNHVCQICGKGFTDKKALNQHEVIHSGDRPLSCDICQQTFKQKASLYTHRKRVHKVFPNKRVVEFMENKPNST